MNSQFHENASDFIRGPGDWHENEVFHKAPPMQIIFPYEQFRTRGDSGCCRVTNYRLAEV